MVVVRNVRKEVVVIRVGLTSDSYSEVQVSK
jgi:hypothetical protein